MTIPRTLSVEMSPQPDDRSCGATCLHAIYRYYDDPMDLDVLMDEIPQLEDGGTLGVHLATHAIRRGYRAKILTYNLQLFDPSWFKTPDVDIAEKLRAQAAAKSHPKLTAATAPYLDFLALGGKVGFEDLSSRVVASSLARDVPVLTGLSATYLYHMAREDPTTDRSDDVAGHPVGHFVVLYGIDEDGRVEIADPYEKNPAGAQHYHVSFERLIGAICLGIVTYDANLVIIEPASQGAR